MTAQPGIDAPAPGRRDPEGRKRAIIAAAAELIIEGGTAALTHRRVAARAGVSLGSTTQYFASLDELRESALEQLVAETDAALDLLAEITSADDFTVADLAPFVRSWLVDPRQVQADLILVSAGASDPTRRALARRWFDRAVAILSERLPPDRARAVAIYVDGAMIHAGLHDEPLDLAVIVGDLEALAHPARPRSTEPAPQHQNGPRP